MEIFIEDCTKLSVSLPFDFLILRQPHDVEIKRIKQALDFHETDPAKQCVVPVVVPTARYDVVPYWFERQLKTFGRSFTDEVCGWQAKKQANWLFNMLEFWWDKNRISIPKDSICMDWKMWGGSDSIYGAAYGVENFQGFYVLTENKIIFIFNFWFC